MTFIETYLATFLGNVTFGVVLGAVGFFAGPSLKYWFDKRLEEQKSKYAIKAAKSASTLKKTEWLFEREYAGLEALHSFETELRPQTNEPNLLWEHVLSDFASQGLVFGARIRDIQSNHNAAFPPRVQELLRDAESAIHNAWEVISETKNGGENEAQIFYDRIVAARELMQSVVDSQRSDLDLE